MNYQEIINNLTIDKVKEILTKFEIPFIEKENCLICKTACHNIDTENCSWKLYYYYDTHLFYCYTNCGSMSIFKFLQNYYETRDIEYDWYEDIYNLIDSNNFDNNFTIKKYESKKDKYSKLKKISLPIYSKTVLDCFIKAYPIEWLNEGISKKAMDKFNILYSISRNKIIIPHYNANNELVGIRGRALDKWEIENIGKYCPIEIENTWYKHPLSLNLYGLNITKENINKSGYCYIFEGEKSVIKCEDFFQPNCSAAVCGSNFNKFIIKILLENCPNLKEIIICFDKEQKKNNNDYFFKLLEICKKYNKYYNFSFVYDKYNLLDNKDSPVDKGEDIFNFLIRKRVKVNEI